MIPNFQKFNMYCDTKNKMQINVIICKQLSLKKNNKSIEKNLH